MLTPTKPLGRTFLPQQIHVNIRTERNSSTVLLYNIPQLFKRTAELECIHQHP